MPSVGSPGPRIGSIWSHVFHKLLKTMCLECRHCLESGGRWPGAQVGTILAIGGGSGSAATTEHGWAFGCLKGFSRGLWQLGAPTVGCGAGVFIHGLAHGFLSRG